MESMANAQDACFNYQMSSEYRFLINQQECHQ